MGRDGFGGSFVRVLLVGIVLSVAVGVLAPAAGVGADTEPEPAAGDTAQTAGFSDIEQTGVHREAVEALAAEGVFDGTGCGPGLFCPGEPILRWVMAVWLVRVLDANPPTADVSTFADVGASHWWSPYVERLAALGVTQGCTAVPARFCPNDPVTRAQMASFLVRAFELEAGPSAGFSDVDTDDTHAANIDALAASGVTAGCTPARFCPRRHTTRAQMATFLARALGLVDLPAARSTLPGAADMVSAAAEESGFGDPYQVELPEAEDLSATVSWLVGDGAGAVGLVTQSAGLWTDAEPRLRRCSGEPRPVGLTC